MEVDNTLAAIIVEIQKRLKAKYNKDLTFEQVVEIVDIQFISTAFGFARNIPVYWKGFLKFIWTNRRVRNIEKKKLFNTVSDINNNLTEKEKEYYHYLTRVVSHSAYKELESLGIRAKALTAIEVKAIPSNSPHFRTFTSILKKKKND